MQPSSQAAVLRLKRSADAAALDEIAVSLPPAKRSRISGDQEESSSTVTPRTMRFRRVVSSVQNRRVIDVDLASLLDSPPTSVPSTPVQDGASPLKRVKRASESKNGEPVPASNKSGGQESAKASEVVFDLYEAVPVGENPVSDGGPSEGGSTRVGWIDSSSLPSEFFGELLPSDDEDEDYSEGDERSVDYPSTPSSSNSGEEDDVDDEKDNISDGEIGYLRSAGEDEGLGPLWNALEPPAKSTRSRVRSIGSIGGSDAK